MENINYILEITEDEELEDELQDWDVTVADGLEDEFDGDPIEDYIPVEQPEDELIVVGDRYPLEQEPEEEEKPSVLTTREKIEEILDRKRQEESEEDKKKS